MSWEELVGSEEKEIPFLIDPYIPEQSIVLLWGDTSLGKSPVTWEMARAIGDGTNFYGLPTKPGKVLYIDVDTPEVALAPRIKVTKKPASNVWFMFAQGLRIPEIKQEHLDCLVAARDDIEPDVVFLNTLRKIHSYDDKDSKAPMLTYGFFQELFPKSALVFVAHIRKSPIDPRIVENERENFSGSKHWLDDCQVGIHLSKYSSRDTKTNLMLWHAKSQVSETIGPMPLHLAKDGSTLTSPRYQELLRIYELLNERPDAKKSELDRILMMEFAISASTAERRRLVVEAGKFPGSRAFLAVSHKNEGET